MRGRLTAAVVGVALLSPVAGSVGPALGATRATSPVALAGTTRVVAPSHPARMVVRVPRSVRYGGQGYMNLPYINVDGTASALAVFLVPVGTTHRDHEIVMFGRLPGSLGRHTIATFPGGTELVAADTYQLVIVHSPGTATLTIRFPGLKGRTTLRPQEASGATMALLSPSRLGTGQFPPSGTSEIVDRRLASTGFISVNLGVALTLGGVTRGETCFYPGGGDLPSTVNVAPGCSDGTSSGYLAVQGDISYGGSEYLNWGPGKYGASVDYQATNLPGDVAGWAAWVPYDG